MMANIFAQLKKPFEAGYWKRDSAALVEVKVKDNNRSSVLSTKKRQSILSNRQSFASNRLSVMSNSPPRFPSWEVMVDQHMKQCLRAAKARDFTYFRLSTALNAKPEAEYIDYKATLFSITSDELPIEELEDLNAKKCDEAGQCFQEYVSEIRKAKDENLAWLAWGRLLNSEEEIAIDRIMVKIKDTNEAAKDVIRDLPLDARDIAAGVWVQGSGHAMGPFRTMCAQVSIISGRVGNFEGGDFEILCQAEEKVQAAVEAGVLAIFDRST